MFHLKINKFPNMWVQIWRKYPIWLPAQAHAQEEARRLRSEKA